MFKDILCTKNAGIPIRIPAFFIESDRDRIQTCNRLIRSQLLYSVELRGHFNLKLKEFAKKSDSHRIQTYNLLIRSQMLYSVELASLVLHFHRAIFCCDRDRIQTCNRLIRSQLLYSVELRGHCFLIASAKVRVYFNYANDLRIFYEN